MIFDLSCIECLTYVRFMARFAGVLNHFCALLGSERRSIRANRGQPGALRNSGGIRSFLVSGALSSSHAMRYLGKHDSHRLTASLPDPSEFIEFSAKLLHDLRCFTQWSFDSNELCSLARKVYLDLFGFTRIARRGGLAHRSSPETLCSGWVVNLGRTRMVEAGDKFNRPGCRQSGSSQGPCTGAPRSHRN